MFYWIFKNRNEHHQSKCIDTVNLVCVCLCVHMHMHLLSECLDHYLVGGR